MTCCYNKYQTDRSDFGTGSWVDDGRVYWCILGKPTLLSPKGDSVKSSERKEDSYISSKEYLSDYKQNVGINKEYKDHSFEISDRKEECATGTRRKGNPCYKASKNLSELCS